jgi:hypothetical protein
VGHDVIDLRYGVERGIGGEARAAGSERGAAIRIGDVDC